MTKPTKRRPPPPKKRGKNGGTRPGAGRPKKRWLKDYEQLGAMPSDPLYQMEWGYQSIMVSLQKTIADPHLDEKTRSDRIIKHMLAASKCQPTARIAQAEKVILEAERRRIAPAAPVTGSEELTDASPVDPPPLAAGPRTGLV